MSRIWMVTPILALMFAACAPTATARPDLTVRAQTSVAPPVCFDTHSRIGAMVTVTNSGGADAGPFMVEVNAIWQAVPDGLKAGQSKSLWFDSGSFGIAWTQMNVKVDPADQVAESDELNNTFTAPVMTLTPPLPCATMTPAPTVTPSQ
jgi:hypothetical protein